MWDTFCWVLNIILITFPIIIILFCKLPSSFSKSDNNIFEDYKVDWAVKSICNSCRGLWFCDQHPHNDSQLFVTLFPGVWMIYLLNSTCTIPPCIPGAHTYMLPTTQIHKVITNKYFTMLEMPFWCSLELWDLYLAVDILCFYSFFKEIILRNVRKSKLERISSRTKWKSWKHS